MVKMWVTNMDGQVVVGKKNPIHFEPETADQAKERIRNYLQGKTIGKPQGSERYSAEQLEELGLVGIYIE